jgi:carbamoyl-phosphate synthase large subunit
MRKNCRVLVTGAGSGVGQGIVKALRIADLPITIIAADIAPMNVALYRADEAIIVPKVEEDRALQKIVDLLKQHRIDVVMIGSEFDLVFFSTHKAIIESLTGVFVIAAALETVKIADDKWLTAEFLREKGLPYAQACLPESADDAMRIADDWGYPLILKTRRGTSSRHVYVIRTPQTLEECYASTPLPMLQRLINIPSSELSSEYTCSVFKTADGNILGPFTARRTVRGGTSWHIEVARFEELNSALLAIGHAMDFVGSLNIQLMLTAQGPVPFELNARFSGTTAVRAHFGFNEPAMALRSYFYGEAIAQPEIKCGIALRYHEEVFIEDVRAVDLAPGQHKGFVKPWF